MLVWERPWALWLLVFLGVVLWRSLQRGAPIGRLLGTLEFWPREKVAGEERRRGIPPARWALVCAMGAAVLGMAGPAWQGETTDAPWRVIVDRSPSMGLVRGSEGSRLGVALELLDSALDRSAARIFVAGDASTIEHRGERPPRDWVSSVPRPEPDWARFDQPRTIWLTDRMSGHAPVHACVVASGGDTVPGVVALDGQHELFFDGIASRLRPSGQGPQGVEVRGPAASQIAALARIWVESRGHRLTDEQPALLITCAMGPVAGAPEVQQIEQDGWSLRGHLIHPAEGRPWAWAQPSGLPAVAWSPGFVDVQLLELGQPAGDLGGLARSFGDLLDRALVPTGDVVALGERGAVGAGGVSGTFEGGAAARLDQDQRLPRILLAGLATCLGLLALILSRRSPL